MFPPPLSFAFLLLPSPLYFAFPASPRRRLRSDFVIRPISAWTLYGRRKHHESRRTTDGRQGEGCVCAAGPGEIPSTLPVSSRAPRAARGLLLQRRQLQLGHGCTEGRAARSVNERDRKSTPLNSSHVALS